MVKSIVLDNVRVLCCIFSLLGKKKKSKNPSDSCSFSRGYHFKGSACKLCHHTLLCSSLLASWKIFSWRRGWIFSRTFLLFENNKKILTPWGAVGKVNNSCLLLHLQSLSIGHYNLTLIYNSGIWAQAGELELGLVLAFSLSAVQAAVGNQTYISDSIIALAKESWRAYTENFIWFSDVLWV